MEAGFGELTDGQLVAVIDVALNALGDDRLRLPTDRELLDLLRAGLRVDARLRAWQQQLAARIEAAGAAWNEHRTSTTTWLAEADNLTPREAVRLVKAGQELARFPIVGAAATGGQVLPGQAEAITGVLRNLPNEFPTELVDEAEQLMVGFAANHNAAELRRLTGHLLDVLAPDTADALEAARLERELKAAQRNRHVEFHSDGHGSVLIRGSLPVASAEPFIRIVDAYAAAEKRALDAIDPYAEVLTPAMRRADGLLAMVHRHSQESLAPGNGGDRPRIVVTVSYDQMIQLGHDTGLISDNGCQEEPGSQRRTGCKREVGGQAVRGGRARLVTTGEPLAPSVLRQLLCDADVLPVVLGGPSEILDVGRSQRLVTPAIRAALDLRDGGCIFAGCDKPPDACHAHHTIPWRLGGATSLSGLVLVCPHHHGIVEPGPDPGADRWHVRLRPDGIPEVIPPRRVDPHQRPRLHARFQTPGRS